MATKHHTTAVDLQPIDFLEQQFPAPNDLTQLLMNYVDKRGRQGRDPTREYVKSELVYDGITPVYKAFDKCHGRTKTYRWFLWRRYQTGEVRRHDCGDLRICPVCGTIQDPDDMPIGHGDAGKMFDILMAIWMIAGIVAFIVVLVLDID